MSYYFFMDKIQLPVAPAKLQMKINNKNKTVDLINDGEVNILKTPGLSEVSFEALLPNVPYPFATYFEGFQKAEYFLDVFKQLKTALAPFQFIVSRMTPKHEFLFDTNLTVTLEDYDIVEDARNGFDVMVSIRLKQYRHYATKVLNTKKNEDGTTTASVDQQRHIGKRVAVKHIVKAGETLYEICKKELGDGSRWPAVAKSNGITNPNALQVGQVIMFVK
jgi:nucleoid-associated protein YgaU